MKKIIFVVVLMSVLPGCSVFSPVKNDPQKEYLIDALPHSVPTKYKRYISILVPEPYANTIYNSLSMAYSLKRYQINYFSKNRWAATPPQMLQPLIVDTLQKTHHFRSVGGQGALGYYDYILHTEILEFQQDFYTTHSAMNVKVRAQIIRTTTNRVVATKEFKVIEVAPQSTPYGGVIAANRAVSKVLSQLAAWSIRAI